MSSQPTIYYQGLEVLDKEGSFVPLKFAKLTSETTNPMVYSKLAAKDPETVKRTVTAYLRRYVFATYKYPHKALELIEARNTDIDPENIIVGEAEKLRKSLSVIKTPAPDSKPKARKQLDMFDGDEFGYGHTHIHDSFTMKFSDMVKLVMEMNDLGGAGLGPGPGCTDGIMSGPDVYAPGDNRTPVILGMYTRKGKMKKKSKKKKHGKKKLNIKRITEGHKPDDSLSEYTHSFLKKILKQYYETKQPQIAYVDEITIGDTQANIELILSVGEDDSKYPSGQIEQGFENYYFIEIKVSKNQLETGKINLSATPSVGGVTTFDYYSIKNKTNTYAFLYYILMHELTHAKQYILKRDIDTINSKRKGGKSLKYKDAKTNFDEYINQNVELDANMQAAVDFMVRRYEANAETIESNYTPEEYFRGLMPQYFDWGYKDDKKKLLKKAFFSAINDKRAEVRKKLGVADSFKSFTSR